MFQGIPHLIAELRLRSPPASARGVQSDIQWQHKVRSASQMLGKMATSALRPHVLAARGAGTSRLPFRGAEKALLFPPAREPLGESRHSRLCLPPSPS